MFPGKPMGSPGIIPHSPADGTGGGEGPSALPRTDEGPAGAGAGAGAVVRRP